MADSNSKERSHLIFTYGTLKRGFHNHSLMEELIVEKDAEFIGDQYSTATPHPLVCGPHGVPYLIALPGSGRRVSGELYAVTDRGLERLDLLERLAHRHYERLPIRLISGHGEISGEVSAEAYFAHRSFAAALWEKRRSEGLEEFSAAENSRYVKRRDRPFCGGVSLVEEIRNFLASG